MKHGLFFEQTTSLNDALNNAGFTITTNGQVYNSNGVRLGYSKSKRTFIKWLNENGVDLSVNSDMLLPDDAFINIINNTVYIIEKKYQCVAGSVDEKLQTCLYKKMQYNKLVSQIGYGISYIYVLNDWFKQPKYHDVLGYIENMGCLYYFNVLPIEHLGLTNGL